METVINKLSEIEAAANKIMETANNQKKEMAKSMELKTKEFDTVVEKETLQELEQIRAKQKKDMSNELNSLESKTNKTLQAIDKEFADNHDAIATSIYEKIIRM